MCWTLQCAFFALTLTTTYQNPNPHAAIHGTHARARTRTRTRTQQFLKRYKRALGRQDVTGARDLAERRPTITLDHLVKERCVRAVRAVRNNAVRRGARVLCLDSAVLR